MDRAELRLSWLRDMVRAPGAAGIAGAFAALAIGLGVFGMSGWINHKRFLWDVIPTFVTVNPATCICMIMGGISIALSLVRRPGAACVAGLVVVAVATAKIVDLLFGGVPVDRLLFADQLATGLIPFPSRMAPNTAAAFLMSGMALCLLHVRHWAAKLAAQLLAIWMTLFAVFATIGYSFDLVHFSQFGTYLPMALPTALGIVACGLGALALTRDVGLMFIARDRGPAGVMLRITLPLLIIIPLVVGILRLWGERNGYYGPQAGIALQIMSSVVVTSTLLMVSVLALFRSDLARRDRERELRISEQFSRLVASANPDCISLLDKDFMMLFANDALMRSWGMRDRSQLVGYRYGYRLDAASKVDCDAALQAASRAGSGRFSLCVPDEETGEARWFDTIISQLPPDHDWPFRYIAISRDISDKREIEEQVRWKASHDDLTRLPNRAQFQTHLDRHVRQVGQEGFAMFMLDIDNFKMVNDTLGHDAGDRLLKTVAERINRAVRHGDIVARLAGDEFAVIARDIRTEPAAVALAERIFESLREPWRYQGRLNECRVSIGASLAPRHGDCSEELLKHADIALYEAKSRGKGQIAVFRQTMKSAVEKRNRQVSLARRALARDFIVPYYQPKIDLASGRVAGFEALLRWRHPSQGVQTPSTIAAAFEDMELGSQITQRMLDKVLLDMRAWQGRGLPFGSVAINVTAADLRQDDFANGILAKLESHGLPRHCLQVEITETVFMGRGAEHVEKALRVLHDAGIRVALDDFGTGYASLSHLKQFPVDIVKIDRSFLQDFARDPQNQAIINTVINLGHSLDIKIVAEGVETVEQERHLLARGCTYGQGFLYGKAVSALRVPRLVASTGRQLRRAA